MNSHYIPEHDVRCFGGVKFLVFGCENVFTFSDAKELADELGARMLTRAEFFHWFDVSDDFRDMLYHDRYWTTCTRKDGVNNEFFFSWNGGGFANKENAYGLVLIRV